MKKKIPTPPSHLTDEAKVEWRRLHRLYTIDEDCIPVLIELLEAQDRKREARARVEQDGLFVTGGNGSLRPHPGLAVERDCRLAILRCLKALGLPIVESPRTGRPPLQDNR